MATLYDHNGVVINWTCSILLEKAGFRKIYPDPVKSPGFTDSDAYKAMPTEKLVWTPKSDERERIDFIYYYPNSDIKILDATIVGHDNSICRSKVVKETLDKFRFKINYIDFEKLPCLFLP